MGSGYHSAPSLTIVFLILLVFLASPLPSFAATSGETCSADGDCDAGLHCDGCDGQSGVCVSIKPFDPNSKGKDLPFNEYSWLTTHNSFALRNAVSATGAALVTFTNQEDNITSQLNNGVRGLMLDMYDFRNDIWLCHSFGGVCYNFTAFQPAINVLKEIETFLAANPSEVITIFIEDYVKTPNGLSKVFNSSGLMKYWFPVDQMPKNGNNWPSLSNMIEQNHRLIVFTSIASKEASEGIAYEWNYVVENQYGDGGMNSTDSCPNRSESSAMSNKSRSLVLMNYFPTNPSFIDSCRINSGPMLDMLSTCHNLSADRWANFVAADFYRRGDAAEAVDVANGNMVCGCGNIAYCKANGTRGDCVNPPPKPSSTPATKSPATSASPPAFDASINGSLSTLLKTVAVTMMLLLEFT